MIRALARLALLLWAVATVAAAGWALAHHPFARPVLERSADEVRAALTRAMAREVTPDWLFPRLQVALEDDDPDQIELLMQIAADHGITPPEHLRARVQARLAEEQGWKATAQSCAACMGDINACRSLSQIGTCAIPFELSPLGDLNALRRNADSWLHDQPVDQLEVGLALAGLAATGATVVTAGGSAPVKIGATALRVARRADALSPGMTRALRRAATEAGGAERLAGMAGDVTRIARATSPAEVLPVLRLAQDAPDLARLTRFAESAGQKTRKALIVLGKARALRALNRLSTLAVATIGLVALAAAQIGALMAAILKLLLRRAVAPRRK